MERSLDQIKAFVSSSPGICIVCALAADGRLLEIARDPRLPRREPGCAEGSDERDLFDDVLPADQDAAHRYYRKLAESDDDVSAAWTRDCYLRVALDRPAPRKNADYVWLHVSSLRIGTYRGMPLMSSELHSLDSEMSVFHQLMGIEDDLTYIVDARTHELLYANEAATRSWGSDDYAGQTCHHFIKGLDAPCSFCFIDRMGEDERINSEEYDPILKRWFHIRCERIDAFGRKAYLTYARDISSVRGLRSQLAEDDELIRTITSTVFEYIALIDVGNRTIEFRNVNENLDDAVPAAARDYDENRRQAIHRLVVPEEREEVSRHASLENLVEQLGHAETYSFEWTQPARDGGLLRKQLEFCWLDRRQGRIIAMKSDVTDAWHVRREQIRRLAQATEEAERANRAKTDFLSRVSHDMRTPLNGIMGLSALMRGETDPARLDADLDQLDVSGSYLMRLINDTLDLDRIERGKMRLDPTVRDARQAFSEVQELMAPSAKERGIDLTWHVCELTHDPVYIDLGAVEQVIVNVVGNAVKFTPRGGSVDVTVERVSDDGDSLLDRVTVRDDGIGISAEFLPHVFEPFAQERDDIAGRGQSSGLGMAITKQMCELMGGCISVESTEGEGTTVTLTLRIPRATAEQLAEKRAADEKADVDALQGKGVLLCEDNDLNAEIARRLLEKAGCVVTRVADGQQGVDRVSADPAAYDIVLMDMRMPRMNGLKATQTIRSLADPIAATVPIIAMTANTYDEDVELCRLAGMDGHLAKPIEPDRMYRMLASHLRDRTDAAPLT